ncbi:MAG: tetratricopeptide repeat protein [Vicinamibacterales bacterium]
MNHGTRVSALVLAGSLAALAAACAPGNSANTPRSRQELQPCTLPDYSKMEESVQAQMRDRYGALTSLTASSTADAAELGLAHGEMGKLLMAAGYVEAAGPCFLNAHALTPQEPRWPYYLGRVYLSKDDLKQAAAFFEKTLSLRPDDEAALVSLGSTRLTLNEPDAAESAFDKAFSAHSQSAAALAGLGRIALARRDYPRAVQRLEAAASLSSQSSVVQYHLATAYRALGDTVRAEAYLKQAGVLELLPDDPLMRELDDLLQSSIEYQLRGDTAMHESNWALAIAHYRKASELAPSDPIARHKLGTAWFFAGEIPPAVRQFEEALRLSPGFAKARFSLGLIMASKGDMSRALEQMATAVKDDPGYIEARLRLADMLRQAGRWSESLAQYEQVTRLAPQMAEGSLGAASALIGLKKYEEARQRLIAGQQQYPDRQEFARALQRFTFR